MGVLRISPPYPFPRETAIFELYNESSFPIRLKNASFIGLFVNCTYIGAS
jgi:hypothetical protein